MTIFGKRLSEYVAFSRFFLILIPVVGIIRLALSLNGTPNSTARWFSITVLVWIAVFYYSIRAQITGFGSYRHLLPVFVLLQSVAAQLIIVGAIVLAIFTGTDNIFSAPEYAFGSDGKTWFHVAAHLLIGTTVAPLICWLVGCVVMFVTKKLATGEKRPTAQRA